MSKTPEVKDMKIDIKNSRMLGTRERNELRKEVVRLMTRADELHQLVRQMGEQLDRERAANERLTQDCERPLGRIPKW